MSNHHLAQLNIAKLIAPIDSPQLRGFVEQLDEINALADAAPGFVWRLMSDAGDATDVDHPFGADTIVNMSVWESVEDLHTYVYRSVHKRVMAKRKEWFERAVEMYNVLWWVRKGHLPAVDEAQQKLAFLRAHGPTAEAFTFKRAFAMPAATAPIGRQKLSFDEECPAS